ncbi:MAG: RluA family pseudouridine synthase [Bacilli bacterium]
MNIIKIPSEAKNKRLDIVLAELLKLPRAQVQQVIKAGNVTLLGNALKASYKVNGDEEIRYTPLEVITSDLTPYDFKLDIIYEDEYFVIVNKPAGLVVHPSYGHKDDTLVNALIARYKDLSDVNGPFRPGIVHRLDKETSGLLIVCKNNDVHNKLAALLKKHEITRTYYALVQGHLHEDAGVIKTYLTRSKENYQKMANTPATGKLAITHFAVKERFHKYMLLKVNLETGRTHQIRAHMEYINTPIVGDKLYGKDNLKLYNKGQLLHAGELSFKHPITRKEVRFKAPLPPYFNDILNRLRQGL